VEYWNGDSTPATFNPGAPCQADQGLERLTIAVTASPGGFGGAYSKSLTVLKRITP
jgi:hypothetical protein